MKRAVIAAVIVMIVGFVFFGSITAWFATRRVTVVIANETDESIRSAQVIYEKGKVAVRDVPPHQSRRVHFRATGETSYHLEVVFASGRAAHGMGSYAEPGYSFREHVREKGIENELIRLPAF